MRAPGHRPSPRQMSFTGTLSCFLMAATVPPRILPSSLTSTMRVHERCVEGTRSCGTGCLCGGAHRAGLSRGQQCGHQAIEQARRSRTIRFNVRAAGAEEVEFSGPAVLVQPGVTQLRSFRSFTRQPVASQ